MIPSETTSCYLLSTILSHSPKHCFCGVHCPEQRISLIIVSTKSFLEYFKGFDVAHTRVVEVVKIQNALKYTESVFFFYLKILMLVARMIQ